MEIHRIEIGTDTVALHPLCSCYLLSANINHLGLCVGVGGIFFSGTYNRNVHLYDVETHEHRHALSGHLGAVAALATSPTGCFLATGSHDSTVQVLRVVLHCTLEVLPSINVFHTILQL